MKGLLCFFVLSLFLLSGCFAGNELHVEGDSDKIEVYLKLDDEVDGFRLCFRNVSEHNLLLSKKPHVVSYVQGDSGGSNVFGDSSSQFRHKSDHVILLKGESFASQVFVQGEFDEKVYVFNLISNLEEVDRRFKVMVLSLIHI